ncbi:MAG: aldo/keto reductase [Christiangramia sp.]
MMILAETYTLNNGVKIPKLALGTWMIENGQVGKAVEEAVQLGYRHIDTAQAYQNEDGVGAGIKACGVDRKELFITTKLAAEVKDFEGAKKAIDESLKKLDLEYIDMMIIHSPQPWQHFRDGDYFEGNLEAWKALEEAYKSGKLRAIGLSNFQQKDIENILKNGTVKPAVNQILAHIGKTPFQLMDFANENGMLTEAYSPIGHGVLLKHEEVSKMAEKYGVSVPQLAIRYTLQLGLLPLPKTANPAHMKANAAVDFEISETDMELLKAVEEIKDYGEANKMPVFAK